MLTKNEITALNLSPTKKDFVQIWNELLEVAGKLSERWDPTSTNESDPGIVLLKALTGIADKLNYNIDKNTLEAFMPTAAQEESMRKLCDMLGYTMKYYRSAETTVNIKYHNSEPSAEEQSKMAEDSYIPKFTVLTNSDQDINYFTTAEVSISATNAYVENIPCMEGQLIKCESLSDNNVITINQIDENNRFYLPETQVAENGIFIYNVTNSGSDVLVLADGDEWLRVNNLNIQARGEKLFKFGYDSYENRPYIEFPEDYSELFGEGIFIYYTRTSGINGNISPRTLTQLELPTGNGWDAVAAESFSVENITSANSGANPETIKQAYRNFKKTVGTFETLVTCRDYMNKIYSLTSNGKPRVSNALVTDIRNDINRAITICSCDSSGILYKDIPLETNIPLSSTTKPIFNSADNTWRLGSIDGMELPNNFISDARFVYDKDGSVEALNGYWVIKQEQSSGDAMLEFKTPLAVGATEAAINQFDLVFYPFKAYSQITGSVRNSIKDIRTVYDASYALLRERDTLSIAAELEAEGIKAISHNPVAPRKGDLVSINNYLRLNATIATNYKVTELERELIINNIKIALANAFNMHELDFGDEIPFDSIVEVIETADSRIKVASLNEPALYTTFSILEDNSNNTTKVVEYAVASDWLDIDMAKSADRLTKTVEFTDDKSGNIGTKTVSTFNTKEAKQIYNKLAVRNVLAGRVALFNYNNTFKTSFYESTYQVTKKLEGKDTIPVEAGRLREPKKEEPFTIYTENGIVYTGQYIYQKADATVGEPAPESPEAGIPVYTATNIPEDFSAIVEDNTIKETVKESTATDPETGEDIEEDIDVNYITDINTDCELIADDGVIKDVTLEAGELVKFRAPNFTTVKTYPAYVNYHLKRAISTAEPERAAKAYSLFSILNNDITTWSTSNTGIHWQRVLDYFRAIDIANNTEYRKTFTVKQVLTTKSGATSVEEVDVQKSNPIIAIETPNTPAESSQYTVEQLMALSGCVKLTNGMSNGKFVADVAWTPQDNEVIPEGVVLPSFILDNFSSPFITNVDVIKEITDGIDSALATYRQNLFDTEGALGCSFTVSLTFECVPFEATSLGAWETFISTCAANYDKTGNTAANYQVFDFKPLAESKTYLWRMTSGNSYVTGKYVLDDGNKLLKFSRNYFGSLPSTTLSGVYVVEDFGADAIATVIPNNAEYQLRKNEYLFIEYTPSTTTEDGTSQTQEPVTEIYKEGTIIRPSGFENNGLVDSSNTTSSSSHKSVVFEQYSNTPISMLSFGANEQLEIRELAEVVLSSDSFSSGTGVNLYKNFNDCKELEKAVYDEKGDRINNTYTLKDGEYVFYTDTNKADFAYYTSGTQITLTGDVVIPQCDTIELSTIFDSGLQEIPWKFKELDTGSTVKFQEFQYITLGAGDTIESLKTVDGTNVDATWQECLYANYSTASNPDNPELLQTINIPGRQGNGWEVCSTLELDATSSAAQTLRSIDGKIRTSMSLTRTSTIGGIDRTYTIAPQENLTSNAGVKRYAPLSFKTNLDCQACGNAINIDDVLYNPDKLKSFQLKVFAKDAPTLVKINKSEAGAGIPIIPYKKDTTTILDFATWQGEPVENLRGYQELWNQVPLDKISIDYYDSSDPDTNEYDYALRLPISILKDTYCVFCIYVSDADTTKANSNVWIEALPGTKPSAITLLNGPDGQAFLEDNRLYLTSGINCIRVGSSCKLFVRAAKDTQGMLYFDEPRLVSIQELKYKTSTNNEVSLYTSGLNLEQLGYLDVTKTSKTKDKLDQASKEKLKNALISATQSDIERVATELDEEIYAIHAKFNSVLPIIDNVVKIEQNISTDLANLKKLNEYERKYLINQYNTISTARDNEKALSDALKNNVKASEINNQLLALLASLSTIEPAKQQLLDELVSYKATIMQSLKNISEETILADYSAATDNVYLDKYITDIFREIKTNATNLIEADYQEQLTTYVNSLAQIVTSEDRNTLMEILADIRASELSDTKTRLQLLVTELANTLELEALNSILDEMLEAANTPDFPKLYFLATTLSNSIDYRSLTRVISEINNAVNESDAQKLHALVAELSDLIYLLDGVVLDETGEDVEELDETGEDSNDSNPTIRGTINAIADAAKTNVDNKATEVDTKILEDIKTISSQLNNDIKNRLEEIVGSFNSYMTVNEKDGTVDFKTSSSEEEPSSVKELINLLEALHYTDDQNQSSQIKAVVTRIIDLINQRTTRITEDIQSVTYADWEESSIAPFIKEAILTVWPASLEERVLDMLTKVGTVFKSAINGTLDAYNTDFSSEFNAIFSDAKNTSVIKTIVGEAEIRALFSKIKTLLGISEQTVTNKALIDSISAYIPGSEELTAALNNNKNNAVIAMLIEDWQTTSDLVKKQQLRAKLASELDNAIYIDEQLCSVIENILWPNITKFIKENELLSSIKEQTVDADSQLKIKYYSELLEEVQEIKCTLISGNLPESFDVVDTAYYNLLNSSAADFKRALSKDSVDPFETPTSSFLPVEITNDITAIKTKLNSIETDFENLDKVNLFKVIADIITQVISIADTLIADSENPDTTKYTDIYESISEAINSSTAIATTYNEVINVYNELENANIKAAIETLINSLMAIVKTDTIEPGYADVLSVLRLEEALFAEIRKLDVNRDFYYTVPIENRLAIELNKSDKKFNTLMNPQINYDINNVNNSFVISKLDIDYLDNGIKIARSSMLN